MALKSIIDAAITDLPFVTTCLVFRCTDAETQNTCARRVGQRKGCADKALLPSRIDFLFLLYFGSTGNQRNGELHGRVSSVDVAHGEDCFRSARWYYYTLPRTLTGSLATPTSSAVLPSCSSQCPRT